MRQDTKDIHVDPIRFRAAAPMGSVLRLLGILCALGAVCAAGGCGYALAGRGAFLPAYVKTIGVPTFANRTTVFNVETLLTQKVRSEFIGRGKYTVLPQSTDVDALLVGEISAISIQAATFTANNLASRYVITMTARIELRDVRANTVLWQNPSLVFQQDYPATSGANAVDPAAFFGQDTNALDRISTEFARTIVSAILEAF
jgi:lipopolysaccharide assembly LptE-like protein